MSSWRDLIGAVALALSPALAGGVDLVFTPNRPEPLPVPQLVPESEPLPGAPAFQELAAALANGGDLDAAAMLARQTLDAARAAFGEKDDRTAASARREWLRWRFK